MTSTRQESCEQRISTHLDSREEQFSAIFAPEQLDAEKVIDAYSERSHIDEGDQRIIDRHNAAAEGQDDDDAPAEPCEWFVNDATVPSWCCNTHMYDGTGDHPATADHPDVCQFGEQETVFTAYEGIVDRFREELQNESSEIVDESVLAVSTKIVMRIELSTGGPGDWLEVELDRERSGYSVENVTYHFNDWFDHAKRRVDQNSSLWQLAEYFAETVSVD